MHSGRPILPAIVLLLLTSACGCVMQSTHGKDQASQQAVRTGDAAGTAQLANARDSAAIPTVGNPEPVAAFYGPMPTGVAVSRQGRIFVNYPKWGDDIDFTVAEVRGGREVPFPNAEINKYEMGREEDTLVSVQSVVIDPADRLWIVDTGSTKFGPTKTSISPTLNSSPSSSIVFSTVKSWLPYSSIFGRWLVLRASSIASSCSPNSCSITASSPGPGSLSATQTKQPGRCR